MNKFHSEVEITSNSTCEGGSLYAIINNKQRKSPPPQTLYIVILMAAIAARQVK